jgi:hypothetical protein
MTTTLRFVPGQQPGYALLRKVRHDSDKRSELIATLYRNPALATQALQADLADAFRDDPPDNPDPSVPLDYSIEDVQSTARGSSVTLAIWYKQLKRA